MERAETNQVDVQGKLDEINVLIKPYQLAWVEPGECVLLEKNARFMTKETLNRLTENVKGDGFLSQLPFAIRTREGKYRVISGNHRVKAAMKAGHTNILILFGDESEFGQDRQMAIQLSHNAITGRDDMTILQELYSSIEDVTLKAYSGVNESELFDYKAMEFSTISESDIHLDEITFVFAPTDKRSFDNLFDALDRVGMEEGKHELIFGNVDTFIEVLTEVRKKYGIKSRSVAMIKLLEIARDHLEEGD